MLSTLKQSKFESAKIDTRIQIFWVPSRLPLRGFLCREKSLCNVWKQSGQALGAQRYLLTACCSHHPLLHTRPRPPPGGWSRRLRTQPRRGLLSLLKRKGKPRGKGRWQRAGPSPALSLPSPVAAPPSLPAVPASLSDSGSESSA